MAIRLQSTMVKSSLPSRMGARWVVSGGRPRAQRSSSIAHRPPPKPRRPQPRPLPRAPNPRPRPPPQNPRPRQRPRQRPPAGASSSRARQGPSPRPVPGPSPLGPVPSNLGIAFPPVASATTARSAGLPRTVWSLRSRRPFRRQHRRCQPARPVSAPRPRAAVTFRRRHPICTGKEHSLCLAMRERNFK